MSRERDEEETEEEDVLRAFAAGPSSPLLHHPVRPQDSPPQASPIRSHQDSPLHVRPANPS